MAIKDHQPISFVTRTRRFLLATISLFILPLNLISGEQQAFILKSVNEIIEVLDEERGYTQQVVINGFSLVDNQVLSLYFSELEEVKSIVLETSKKGKFKKEPDKNIVIEGVRSENFYIGGRVVSFNLESVGEFRISYIINCDQLLYFSGVPSLFPDEAAQYSCIVKMPSTFSLISENDEDEGTAGFSAESSDSGIKIYNLQTQLPIKNQFDKATRLRLSIVPNEFAQEPFKYINNWYLNLLSEFDVDRLDHEELESFFDGASSKDSIAYRAFKLIQKEIRYLDIENGLGAFCPREAQSVLDNKYGDCKDMANLLNEILKVNGIDSYLALSSTISHLYDLDFPSLSSANHLICVVVKNDSVIVLDATEDDCVYGNPSTQIQGRNIYVINDTGGFIYNVPQLTSTENSSLIEIQIAQQSDKSFKGSFKAQFNGIGAVEMKRITRKYSFHDAKNIVEKYLVSRSKNVSYQLINAQNDRTVKLEGEVYVEPNASMNARNNLYIDLGLLLNPFELEFTETRAGNYTTYQTLNSKYIYTFKLAEDITALTVPSIEKFCQFGSFSLEGRKVSNREFELTYNYRLDQMIFTPEERNSLSEFNSEVLKTLDKYVVIEN
ncbi:MAG TPA: hypothetical protein DDX92_05125 [Flavobacteriales bacterium]|jgi:hypothetical protein|nr:hypothetical protein [Flavobacteriales bacterium]